MPAIALAPESVSKLVTEGAGVVGKKQQCTTPLVVKFAVLTTLVEWHEGSHELSLFSRDRFMTTSLVLLRADSSESLAPSYLDCEGTAPYFI